MPKKFVHGSLRYLDSPDKLEILITVYQNIAHFCTDGNRPFSLELAPARADSLQVELSDRSARILTAQEDFHCSVTARDKQLISLMQKWNSSVWKNVRRCADESAVAKCRRDRPPRSEEEH